jgi:anti-anti-sigma regulatory factor
MELLCNESHADNSIDEQVKRRQVTIGYFKIKPSNGKFAFELKGDFNSDNIKGISRAMTQNKVFNKKYFELDMSAVETIDMRAMALLIIALKTLRDNGTEGNVTGLDGEKRELAYELGMQYVSQII